MRAATFYYSDLDLNPMTLQLEFDLDILKPLNQGIQKLKNMQITFKVRPQGQMASKYSKFLVVYVLL